MKASRAICSSLITASNNLSCPSGNPIALHSTRAHTCLLTLTTSLVNFLRLIFLSSMRVVVIRGSAQVADWMINLACRTSEKGYHEGMMRAAEDLMEKLHEIIAIFLETHPEYTLHVCGHSLGGGIATLFGIEWQRLHDPDASRTKVWSFGSPCVVKPEASTKYNSFITSVSFHTKIQFCSHAPSPHLVAHPYVVFTQSTQTGSWRTSLSADNIWKGCGSSFQL